MNLKAFDNMWLRMHAIVGDNCVDNTDRHRSAAAELSLAEWHM